MEDKKLNIFISQPMANKTKNDIEEVRKRVIGKVREYFNTDDLTFMVSNFDTLNEDISVKNEPLYWLSRSIGVLSDSDVIIMATGWEKSRGCRIEYECARLYDIMVIYEDTNYITSEKLFEVDSGTTADY